jgi:hypothetical protein
VIGGRLAQVVAALATALVGLFVAVTHLPDDEELVRFGPLLGAWLVVPLAVLLEAAAGPRARRTAALALGASALTAALTLLVVTRFEPPWWRPAPLALPLGLHLTCAAWIGRPLAPWLVLTLALAPAPLAVLLVRRVARQLEWQVVAATLGPPIVGVTLFPELERPEQVWLLAIAGAPLGVGAWAVDRLRRGPPPRAADRAAGLPPFLAGLLGSLLVAGLVWASGWGRLGARLLPEPVEVGRPDLTALLEDVRARQEAHHAREGEYAPSLGALGGLAPDVAGGYTQGHVLRFWCTGDAWVLTADPAPARLGWPSLRVIGPGGAIERGPRPFPLRAR